MEAESLCCCCCCCCHQCSLATVLPYHVSTAKPHCRIYTARLMGNLTALLQPFICNHTKPVKLLNILLCKIAQGAVATDESERWGSNRYVVHLAVITQSLQCEL